MRAAVVTRLDHESSCGLAPVPAGRDAPTILSMPEVASVLYVSHNTVRTHMSHLNAKLGTAARARALSLLARSPLRSRAHRLD